MKITEVSLKRPITIFMLVLMVLILGFVSLSRLSMDLLPEITFPVGAAITSYSGAGPEEVENMVSRPLEEALSTCNNLKSISSISSVGSSIVIARFNWGTDMDFASLQMREKIDMISAYLPSDVDKPTVFTMDPSLMPVMQINAFGPDQVQLKQVVDDVIIPRLERIEGVAGVDSMGGLQREIKVIIDPSKLQGYGMSLNQVSQALQADNFNMTAGEVTDGKKELLVRVTGEFKNINEISNIVVGNEGGVPIHLYEIANIVDGEKEERQMSRVDGRPGIALFISKQSVANTVNVSNEVREVAKELQGELPPGFETMEVFNQADFIEKAVHGVVGSAVKGGLLAILILLFFLRNLRSTLIVATTIPISIICTCILMYFNGLTLNMMTLGGLALGIGLIVDDAIVVLENIFRHREEGYSLYDAALKGTSEVGNAVVAATLTTVVVFLPVAYVEGMAAQFFKPMALTLAFSVGISLLVALTLVPILSARMIHVTEPKRQSLIGRLYYITGNFLDKMDAFYRRILVWSLGHKKMVVIIVTVGMVLSAALFPVVGSEFLPSTDEGEISIDIKLPVGTELAETDRITRQVEKLVSLLPEADYVYSNVGGGGMSMGAGGDSNSASVNLILVSKTERDRSDVEVADYVNEQLKVIPGAEFDVGAMDFLMGGFGQNPIEVTIKGDDLTVLESLADRAVELVEKIPGTRQIKNSLAEGRPEIQVKINRDKAAGYGLSVYEVASTVRTAMEGSVATRYRSGGEEIDIRVRLAGGEDAHLQELADLTIASAYGFQVPLREIATFHEEEGPNTISRSDQSRQVTVTGAIAERDLGSIMDDIRGTLDSSLALPPGYSISYEGQDKEMMESFNTLGLALILSIFLVYMVMASQFESLLHPLVLMSAIPVTIIGITLSLFMTGRPFSVPAFIGIIMLGGIVVKNAIVLIDYVNTLRRRGIERYEAILRAGPRRLRPILMTALTAIFAMFPLAVGIGEGAELEAPLATVVVGGLIFSTVITLVLVPVLYVAMEDLAAKLGRRLGILGPGSGQDSGQDSGLTEKVETDGNVEE
ncbi:MAG TPA: efflux RND transporter permease subunit [Clostridia bacterium]|nr:efflux RND transporter permease subunit [Clostridia bacterium]